eukprot:gnl/MRDRNA2_/MRDRNA2_64997_c0_seq1.p1 gnl/MRDRNA2_/MRDRNA2_64997_c0~~gnl/MRDRNA2_/MRDRNA2_64997_c0_seq1.p1  ORF type:complete len:549 (-),score=94.49 gnl/MRDRNA2_/MRDRNA2_64997_c0_seq1:192-1838(-)
MALRRVGQVRSCVYDMTQLRRCRTLSDLSDATVSFGKFKGHTFQQVYLKQPEYCAWVLTQGSGAKVAPGFAQFANFIRAQKAKETAVQSSFVVDRRESYGISPQSELIPFGKHKGKQMLDVLQEDANYCSWVVEEARRRGLASRWCRYAALISQYRNNDCSVSEDERERNVFQIGSDTASFRFIHTEVDSASVGPTQADCHDFMGPAQGFPDAPSCFGFSDHLSFQEALTACKKLASEGDSEALASLALLYWNGIGVARSNAEAFEHAQQAATQGHACAQAMLGYMYQEGIGVDQNFCKAFAWYHASAEQGSCHGQGGLGFLYNEGLGVQKCSQKAFELFEKAAKQGHASSQAALAFMYENGIIVNQCYETSLHLYEQSALRGSASGQAGLAFMFQEGKGVERNPEKALEWYTKAAQKGCAAARAGLGFLYDNGFGIPQCFATAVHHYEAAASKGNPSALKSLGFMHERGRGVDQNYEKALEFYQMAADKGSAAAYFRIGFLYQHGRGIKRDLEKASDLYHRALEMGYSPAEKSIRILQAFRLNDCKV